MRKAGQLTEALCGIRPYSVLLLDEIERASGVFSVLLQLAG